jgi:hypothetical protein
MLLGFVAGIVSQEVVDRYLRRLEEARRPRSDGSVGAGVAVDAGVGFACENPSHNPPADLSLAQVEEAVVHSQTLPGVRNDIDDDVPTI